MGSIGPRRPSTNAFSWGEMTLTTTIGVKFAYLAIEVTVASS